MAVIAEGVETAEQLKALVAMGCRLGQGFWLSEARSAKAVDRGVSSGYRLTTRALSKAPSAPNSRSGVSQSPQRT